MEPSVEFSAEPLVESPVEPPPTTISVVIPTWKRGIEMLARTVNSLVSQTSPPDEILIVDMNKRRDDEIGKLPITTYVHAPSATFSLSRGFNIGIKRTRENGYILCTGAEMMFSPNYFEELKSIIDSRIMVIGTCGFLPEDVDYNADWDELVERIIEGSASKVSPGTFQCASRDWWLRVRGYDESLKFAYVDSDIVQRGFMDGLERKAILWSVAQVLHQWHEPSELVSKLGGRLDYVMKNKSVMRNPNGWGEI